MIDVIDMVDMMVVPREIWSAVTRAALRAGRGTAFPPRNARRHS
jgi:hypothetical protein